MATQYPVTREEMGTISGVGEFKLEEYGEVFIDEIIGYILKSDTKSSGIRGKTQFETLKLILEGKSATEIASLRGIHESTVYGHLATLLERGLIKDIAPYLTIQETDQIKKAIEVVGATEPLTPLFNHMEGKVHFGKIRLYLSFSKSGGK
ncbi:MAG: helix-turn-helix domain-containing protein [Cyclobacteriaceae bacterium]|nr:helix-turn-helix domain-containing protein [Cyclobacteriaceae bacterium]